MTGIEQHHPVAGSRAQAQRVEGGLHLGARDLVFGQHSDVAGALPPQQLLDRGDVVAGTLQIIDSLDVIGICPNQQRPDFRLGGTMKPED